MPTARALLNSFNRGLISRLGIARTDLDRLAMSASIMDNWMPRVLGSMMLRPGWGFVDTNRNNAFTLRVPFVYSNTDTAKLEFSEQILRIRVGRNLISRVAVATAITNGTFNTDLTGWTDADDSGAVSQWQTGGYLALKGTGVNAARRRQQVTVAGDGGKEHALRIVVTQGFVVLKVGTTAGGVDILGETTLGTGTHSIAFTPAGTFWIELASLTQYTTLVDSCVIDTSGVFELPTPYLEADLQFLRYDQSGDVVYLTCKGYRIYKIERRGPTTWSFVQYKPLDGPFRIINTTTITLQPSAINGDITLTASRDFFKTTHVGALFKIASTGQTVTVSATGDEQYSNPIRIAGVGASRQFAFAITGVWSGTVTIQQSVGEPGNWTNYLNYTANAGTNVNDGLDNQIVYYRIGTTAYTSGTADASLTYSAGSISGIVEITGYTSPTSVSAIVLEALGNTDPSLLWYESEWSPFRGYPTAVHLYEGRNFFAGKGRLIGSASDGFETFDNDIEGDSAPIQKNIGSGAVDTINWLIGTQRLIIGGESKEYTARSSSFEEPLTPQNTNIKDPSTQGSAAVGAVKVDNIALFVQKSQKRLFQIDYTVDKDDFRSDDLTKIIPEIGQSGIIRLAVQRQPDTRIHCVMNDGTVGVLIFDELENVKCWVTVSTSGFVEDVIVLPGIEEDEVSYSVRRTINGNTVRYLETWSLESECVGGELNKQGDSFFIYDGVPTTTITGLAHLEGRQVIVWGNGKDLTYDPVTDTTSLITVSEGQITLPESVSKAMVGLPYEASFKSTKMAYAAQGGTALTIEKIIHSIGVIMINTHARALKYGSALDDLDNMPLMEDFQAIDPNMIWEEYDKEAFEFQGEWKTDSRLCLKAFAPRPCNILACVVVVETSG